MMKATTMPEAPTTAEAPLVVVVASGIASGRVVFDAVRVKVSVAEEAVAVAVVTIRGAEKFEPTWLVMASESHPLPKRPEALVKRY